LIKGNPPMPNARLVESEKNRFIERRKSERIKCKKYILHDTDPGDFFYRGRVCNYSKRGLYFESNVDLLPKDKITILVNRNSDELTYILDVKIEWCKELNDSKFDVGYGASVTGKRERRTGKDRRVFKYTDYIPERRSGVDRRDTG
jgi:hypothetical protein